jgi:Tfp pilus assembly protein PilF
VQTFLRHGDCPAVIRQADDAISVLGTRPDAYRLKGYCQARLGRTGQAVSSMRQAVDRDPHNWQFRYSLAVAEAAAGMDPRPAAREALRLDPLEFATQDLLRPFRTDRRAWRSQARFLLRAPLF